MNIKEAIERGLYPLDDKGRALVPAPDVLSLMLGHFGES